MKKIAVLSLLLICISSFAFAGTVDLPRTGQTKCYDTSGTEISCTGTGQDGEIQAGVAWPFPRFTDNGDGTFDRQPHRPYVGVKRCLVFRRQLALDDKFLKLRQNMIHLSTPDDENHST